MSDSHWKFRIEESPKEDGSPVQYVEFTSGRVQPLGYAALLKAKPNTKLTIPLVIEGAEVIETNIEYAAQNKYCTISTTLESNFTSRAVGLVPGGWLPSVFATNHNRTIVLPDQNVIDEIRGRFNQGVVQSKEPDFIDLYAGLSVRINPASCAIEGNKRRTPSPEEVQQLLEEIAGHLKYALPSAEVMVNDAHVRGALGIIEDSRSGIEKKLRFLMRLSPYLRTSVSDKDMQKRRDQALTIGDECGVPRRSLVMLAALSSIVVSGGRSPAKKLLKFGPEYSEQDAYNALCDLRSLDLFIELLARFPDQPAQLCTRDRPLALFWTGIGASNFENSGGDTTFDLSPISEIFPEPFWGEYRAN